MIDRTWTWGPLYLDICSGSLREVHFGIALAFDFDRRNCWGRRISLHLLFWCLSVGWHRD